MEPDPTLCGSAPLAELVAEHRSAHEGLVQRVAVMVAPLARAGWEGDLTIRLRRKQNNGVSTILPVEVKQM